jgi:hypothetical protein
LGLTGSGVAGGSGLGCASSIMSSAGLTIASTEILGIPMAAMMCIAIEIANAQTNAWSRLNDCGEEMAKM